MPCIQFSVIVILSFVTAGKNCRKDFPRKYELRKKTKIFLCNVLVIKCLLLSDNGRIQIEYNSVANQVLHGKFHFLESTSLWGANRYEIKMLARTDSGNVFKLDQFLLSPFLPFNVISTQGKTIFPSHFSKTIVVHKHVEKVTSSTWPENKLSLSQSLQRILKVSRVKLPKIYSSLLFDR